MLKLVCVPMFSDNYLWLLIAGNGAVVAVDPGDYALLADYLQAHRLRLATVLITHRHPDHTGGIAAIRASHPNVPVYGPALIPGISHLVHGGEVLDIADMGRLLVMDVRGHTRYHLAYYHLREQLLFCGDSLFSAGCGRIFPDGDATAFYQSLEKIKLLPDSTRLCAAHEYTLANLEFARALEPDNADSAQYQSACRQLRNNNLPTLPALLAAEKKINPFLRCSLLKNRMQEVTATIFANDADVFGAMRRYKDHWQS